MTKAKWRCEGRPRNGPLYENYKAAKCDFRRLHRRCVGQYLQKLDNDLDYLAASDSGRFWKQVKKRQRGQIDLCSRIQFNGIKMRDPDMIKEGWAQYFEALYSPKDGVFDEAMKQNVTCAVNEQLGQMTPDDQVVISPEQVEQSIKRLPKGKAGGIDGLKYEHLIYACHSISPILANMFSCMFRKAFIPNDLKRGVIVTLHKGGNKSRDVPDNYRAITLSSVVFKIFEDIVLQRSKNAILEKINSQQGGFQDGLGCLVTSFVLRETVHYARENGSKLYVAYMDGKKAFDVVWHEGLLFKLINECDLDHTTLLAYRAMYTDMTSCVRYQGHTSRWFPVRQGTRQGGKCSAILYLLYINALIKALEQSGHGLCMCNQADY